MSEDYDKQKKELYNKRINYALKLSDDELVRCCGKVLSSGSNYKQKKYTGIVLNICRLPAKYKFSHNQRRVLALFIVANGWGAKFRLKKK